MRYNDLKNVGGGAGNESDFVPRERQKQVRQLLTLFGVAIAMIIVGHDLFDTRSANTLLAVLIIAALSFFVARDKQRYIDMLLSTEYQNMLFSQATAMNCDFCLFVRSDGSIVYANDGLRKLLPKLNQGDSLALEGVFTHGNFAMQDRERIMTAIHHATPEKMVFPITLNDGSVKDYILLVDPMKRPRGLSVVRGREYHGQRTEIDGTPTVSRFASYGRLDQLVTHTEVGMYAANAAGIVEFVNPCLEKALGYQPGELLNAKIGLHRLLYRLQGAEVRSDYTVAEHRGEVTLKKKQGSLLDGQLVQRLTQDVEGKVTGATGSIILKLPV